MLSKAHRLVTADFDAVMEKGRVTHSSLFVMRHLEHMEGAKFAAVAPQKAAKTAVIRNRTRRRMYEAMRELKADHMHGVHAIVFAKTQAIEARESALIEDMKGLFVKAGLLR